KNRTLQGTQSKDTTVSENIQLNFYSRVIAYNDLVYFKASEGLLGTCLWKTDGTEEETEIVHPINPEFGSGGQIEKIQILNDLLIFKANDGTGDELWISDGTTDGTQMLLDINPTDGSNPDRMTIFGDKMLFVANDGIIGDQLWITDGTEAGTMMLMDTVAGGTDAWAFTEYDGSIFFIARNDTSGYELFITDLSFEGTHLYYDFYEGTNSSYPGAFRILNDKLIVDASSADYGTELWVIDGVSSTPELLLDIYPGTSSFSGEAYTVIGDRMFFAANDGVNGEELWVTDGTTDGTYLFADIYEGGNYSYPSAIREINGKAFFFAEGDMYGEQLYRVEGDDVIRISEIDPGDGNANFERILVTEKLYLFAADNGYMGDEPFVANILQFVTQPSASFEIEEAGSVAISLEAWGEEVQYQWYKDGVEISNTSKDYYGANSNTLVIINFSSADAGTYNCVISDDFYGSLTSDDVDVSLYVNIEDVENNFSIYPNPSTGVITIENAKGSNAVIYDINGKIINQMHIDNNLSNIDLTQNESGVYFIEISDEYNISTTKLIVE
ncbi:MAG: T9SS type A sorting domain-containing protein, partial [Bacteroidales bacterium]|nr:T9SS type A sorting domain-containing protein [Bacteroidales bacterium]